MSEHPEHDFVLDVVVPNRPRSWRAVGIVVATLLMGAAGVWLVVPTGTDSERGSLSPRDTGSVLDTAPLTDPSDATDNATGEATTSTRIDLAVDSTLDTNTPWNAMNTTMPGVVPVAGNGSGYWAAYAAGYCDDGFGAPRCAAALNTFCSEHPPTTWYMPSLIGRHPYEPYSPSEIEHAYAYAQCRLHTVPRYSPLVEWQCTADSSLANRVTSQDVAPGTPLDAVPAEWHVVAWQDCSTTTTCVLVTMAPNTWDVTTTIGWNCR